MQSNIQQNYADPPNFNIKQLHELFADELIDVKKIISDITKNNQSPAVIGQVTNQLLGGGGKMLRPLLTLISARLCNYTGEHHIALAAAVELMHTATLLHDDVVDQSELRRGVKTANEVWGNKTSVLVGDFILGHAFSLMVSSQSVETLNILSNASIIIAEGEVKQLDSLSNLSINKAQYIDIITAKTATLFSAACEICPVIANSDVKYRNALKEFGLNLGIAFQIIDDMLDYSPFTDDIGKNIGDDFQESKVTLPIILAFDLTSNHQEEEFWHRTIIQKTQSAEDIHQAITYMKNNNIFNITKKIASDYIKKAKDNLTIFAESEEKTLLENLLNFVINRSH